MGLREISPLDGRYASKVAELRDHVSEWGLMRRRVQVEVEWLLVLAPQLDAERLRDEYRGFDDEAAAEIKQIEARTNHDVKAVEYYLRERVDPPVREQSCTSG